jgi:hypothetical protein
MVVSPRVNSAPHTLPSPVFGERQRDLAIVPVAAIVPHEDYAPRHEDALAGRIDRVGFIANPIVVAPVRPDRFVLLDGTHRLEYLRAHGFGFAPTQIVRLHDPASVEVATWRHRVAGADVSAVLRAASAAGLSLTEVIETGPVAIPGLATLAPVPGRAVAVGGAPWNDALRRLVGLYGNHERVAGEAARASTSPEADAATANGGPVLVVSFAPIAPSAIEALALAGERIPAGITRVLLRGGRVLGTKTPLHLLRPGVTEAEHTAWLEWVGQSPAKWFPHGGIVAEPGARLYEEPLVVFDADLDVQPLP